MLRRCNICLEHISPTKENVKKITASETEWLLNPVEKYWLEEDLKAERFCLHSYENQSLKAPLLATLFHNSL